MIGESPLCMQCKNYDWFDRDKFSCKAFPAGVPDRIVMGEVSHRNHVKGDGGIKYEYATPDEIRKR